MIVPWEIGHVVDGLGVAINEGKLAIGRWHAVAPQLPTPKRSTRDMVQKSLIMEGFERGRERGRELWHKWWAGASNAGGNRPRHFVSIWNQKDVSKDVAYKGFLENVWHLLVHGLATTGMPLLEPSRYSRKP